jgi:hypothetical protein
VYVGVVRLVAGSYGPAQISLVGWLPSLVAFASYGFILSMAWRRFELQPAAVRLAFRDFPAALALQLSVAPILATHTEYKIIMQQVQPFFLDSALMRADWLLHFGRHPYELLPRWPAFTVLLDFVYLAWFTFVFMAVTATAWLASGRHRARVFVAFILCWALLGCVAATMLSSAGPVYYARLGLGPTYLPLSDYLNGLELLATRGHEALWLGYTGAAEPTGISAMPSMHVAIPTLFALAAWRRPWVRWLCLAFTGLVLLGSIQLAWHYAVDGYFSILAVCGIWWFSGKLVDQWVTWPVGRGGDAVGRGA